ncbi:MAG: DNA repair protein RecN [Muribaculaceae bacterium]|nr:DNA repair protein RecN [Muribaculaceae bacterium]
MLTSLHISNYALIESLDLSLGDGLNIVTGETGSGKSIVLGALALVMGERADSKTISNPEKKTVVEAKFDVSKFEGFNKFLSDLDIDGMGDECILRRELTAKGTSRAFINDTPVNLSLMREVSMRLLDIHTQHENLLLSDSTFQTEVLDVLADNKDLLKKYEREYTDYRKSLKDYVSFRDNLQRNKAETEYNTYQLEQLDALDLREGEQESLEHERDLLTNSTRIKQHISSALNALSRSNDDVLGTILHATNELSHITDYVHNSQSLVERLESARIEIADIVDTLEEYDHSITSSENDLEAIESRLEKIYALQARHHVTSDQQLIDLRKELRQKLEDVENGDEKLSLLEDRAKAAKKAAVLTARDITARRSSVATELAVEIKKRTESLGMPNMRCEIRVSPAKLSSTGMDNVEFLFAFNKNQSLMPVGKTASGGEISRVILALKSLLVEKTHLPTIIFDEVDTGVSGDIANRMAQLMLDISRYTQVITITHIAAVAAHGRHHFKVYKEDKGDSTHTYIHKLNEDERVHELAAMISGKTENEAALNTARTLLETGNVKH